MERDPITDYLQAIADDLRQAELDLSAAAQAQGGEDGAPTPDSQPEALAADGDQAHRFRDYGRALLTGAASIGRGMASIGEGMASIRPYNRRK